VRQIAAALDTAHRAGLVHRDVKPANILVTADDHAYLTDFGIAKRESQTDLTRTSAFLGTVDYCSPEQIEHRHVDARTDIYALGCVLFHCLAGRPPFQRDSQLAVVKAHLVDPPPLLGRLVPGLPARLDDVIETALAKHPQLRFNSAGALARAADSALVTQTPDPGPSRPANARDAETVMETALPHTAAATTRAPQRSRRKALWVISAALAVAFLASALIVALASRGSPARTKTRATPPPQLRRRPLRPRPQESSRR